MSETGLKPEEGYESRIPPKYAAIMIFAIHRTFSRRQHISAEKREEANLTQSRRNSPLSNSEILLFLPLQDLSRLRAWSKFAH